MFTNFDRSGLRQGLTAILLLAALTLGLGTHLATVSGQEGESPPTDQELLEGIDEARFVESESGYVSETVDIRAERPDGVEEATVQLLLKLIEDDQYRLLIRFLAPEENIGQEFLILEDETVLLCTSDLEMPLKISGGTDVYGDSTVTTTAGIRFSEGYEVLNREETTLNEELAVKVDLQALDEDATYPAASVWIDPANLEPRQVILFALSGDPLNRISYEEYAELHGDQYLKQQLIENLLQEGFKTRLTTTGISTDPLAEELFDPEKFCRPEEG